MVVAMAVLVVMLLGVAGVLLETQFAGTGMLLSATCMLMSRF